MVIQLRYSLKCQPPAAELQRIAPASQPAGQAEGQRSSPFSSPVSLVQTESVLSLSHFRVSLSLAHAHESALSTPLNLAKIYAGPYRIIEKLN